MGVEVWGVLNVTPDSFSDGGAYLDPSRAVAHAERLIAEGADVIDVGGESSRPPGTTYGKGAAEVSAFEELRRVLPVIERLVALGLRVSIDTVKAEVAREALKAGAQIVNDVSCARGIPLLEAVAEAGAELVIMHNRGRGERSGANVVYGDVVSDVCDELSAAALRATALGVLRDGIWLDPGIGFAKTSAQSMALVAATDRVVALGHRVLMGPSRKSFIADLAPEADGKVAAPDARLGGTAAAVTLSVLGGCHAVRVHDVAMMRQAVRIAEAARGGPP